MRVYGDIETNLSKLEIKGFGYSVDSLLFESEDGQSFNIDFEEGDYGIKPEGLLFFRLKSLGITFNHDWTDLKLDEGKDLEHSVELFKKSKLKSLELYIYVDEYVKQDEIEKLKFENISIELHIDEDVIGYSGKDIEIGVGL